MEITQVKIFPVQEDKLKAFVSVVFDQCFMVNDIKVIQGKDGLFLSMPSRRKKSGEFKDVAHPLNNEMRRRLEESVLAEYRAMVDDQTPRRPDREFELGEEGSDGRSETESMDARPTAAPTPPATAAAVAPVAAVESAPRAVAGGAEDLRQASLNEVGKAPSGGAGNSTGGPGAASEDEDPAQKTLEEVQKIHLRDSFWSVS